MLKRILCNNTDFSICELHYTDYNYNWHIYIFLPFNDKLHAATVRKRGLPMMAE
jgi:hypothetical protein